MFLSFQSRKQPPSFGEYEEKYYVCRDQKLLEGGIFNKGPKKKFPENNNKLWCYQDEWEEIDKNTFKELAISIQENAKGLALLDALGAGLEKAPRVN